MNMTSEQNPKWNVVLIALTVILVTLVTLHIRQRQHATDLTATVPPPPLPAPQVVPTPSNSIQPIHVTAANVAEIEARNRILRPTYASTASDSPVEIRQALKRQTLDLLEESQNQPVSEADKRALALSPEEILQLEKEGRMAY